MSRIDASPPALSIAMLAISAFVIVTTEFLIAGIGLGAIVGGYTIERSTLADIGYVAAAIALFAALIAVVIGRRRQARFDAGLRAPGVAGQ
ncbi:hypothetical protein ACV229_27810 [Burkholderia sp. MR1-5-21]